MESGVKQKRTWVSIQYLCVLFCVLGRNCMTNECFFQLSDEGKARKFKNALSELSDNCLTDEEIRIITSNISRDMQYVIRAYFNPEDFLAILAVSDSYESKTLIGSALAGVPANTLSMFNTANTAAVITKNKTDGKNIYYIHVYIPSSRGKRRNLI